jgi:16S rRNA processing protein RimM
MQDQKICVGIITKPHGIRGHVCVRSFCEQPENLLAYNPIQKADGSVVEMKQVGEMKDSFIVQIKGVSSRNEAELLAKTELYIERDQLEDLDDAWYVSDLEGLEVRTLAGKVLGAVISVENFGAGDILNCKTENGKEFMIPFSEDAVITVDSDFLIISEYTERFLSEEKA